MPKSLLEDPRLRAYIRETYPEIAKLEDSPKVKTSRLRVANLEMFSASFFYDVLPSPRAYENPEAVLRKAGVLQSGARIEVSKHQPPSRGKFVEITKDGRLELKINLLDPSDPRNLRSIH